MDPDGRNFWDIVQGGLDVVGVIPGVGEIADLANAGISLARGDYLGASLSLISVIPIVGDAIGKTGKAANAVLKYSDEIASAIKGLNNAQIDKALSVKKKVQHAGDHLVKSNIITSGDVATQAEAIYRGVLKNPDGVIDYTLRDGTKTTAYLGKTESGENLMVLIRQDNGIIATSFVPNEAQLKLFD